MIVIEMLKVLTSVLALLLLDQPEKKSDELSDYCRGIMMEQLGHLRVQIIDEGVIQGSSQRPIYRAKVRARTSNEVHQFECYRVDDETFIRVQIGSEWRSNQSGDE